MFDVTEVQKIYRAIKDQCIYFNLGIRSLMGSHKSWRSATSNSRLIGRKIVAQLHLKKLSYSLHSKLVSTIWMGWSTPKSSH